MNDGGRGDDDDDDDDDAMQARREFNFNSDFVVSQAELWHFRNDWMHVRAGHVARLNHGSFGAAPGRVLSAQERIRQKWLANPDEFYFGGELVRTMRDATIKAAEAMEMHGFGSTQEMSVLQSFSARCCLVENATIAAAAVLQRWAKESSESRSGRSTRRETILTLDCAYAAVKVAIQEYCVRATGTMDVAFAHVPFGDSENRDGDYASWKAALMKNVHNALEEHRPRFVLLDHITSQPAMKLPIAEMVSLCRQCPSVQEIAVDGSHAIGNLIPEEDAMTATPTRIDADFYWTNLHKWGYTPHSACLLYAKHRLSHPIVSWDAGKDRGILDEVWTGTRDYSSCMVVPHAVDYLITMEEKKMGAMRNRDRVWEEAEALASAWRTPWPTQPKETASGMVMVQLPHKYIEKCGRPGAPGGELQNELRSKGIEVTVGNFHNHVGYLRLSHAVYNSYSDYERLRDALKP